MNDLILFVSTPLVLLFIQGWKNWRSQLFLVRRECAGALWKRSFPMCSKQEIRTYLHTLNDAFALSKKLRLKIEPDDNLITIYQSLYGGKTPYADAMECEFFVEDLAHLYGIPFEEICARWQEKTTVGELLAYVSEMKRAN